MWQKSRRIALATKITIDHVCASSAIPVVFSPVRVTTDYGTDYFGDGCLRLHAPLSPVIRLGADRILAIGLRSEKAEKENAAKNGPLTPGMGQKEPENPPLAQILGVTLNAIFLDHLDADVEHLFRLNQIISQARLNSAGISEPIRIIEPLVINPSYDLGRLAETFSHKMPAPIRYLMAGLGQKMPQVAILLVTCSLIRNIQKLCSIWVLQTLMIALQKLRSFFLKMNRLLWVDLEMTGLDIEKEVIIEAAVIVTDLEFKPLVTYHAIVKQDQKLLDSMDAWNTKHHGESGLTASVPNGRDPQDVEEDLLKIVNEHFPGERAVLAGNSISQDRLFINKYFKKLSERLHYRTVDVTSWKIIFNDKFKIKYDKKNTHRALDDILESIAELQFYTTYISLSPLTPP
ncbi:unnamed protein product [Sphagnum balticum]